MFWKKAKEDEKRLKALSEKEIQKQLYGEYLDKDERRVEVMDSSVIVEHKNERPIEEKYDAKIKKELGEEIDNLKVEFKRLKDEVNRLRKKREALERAEAGFKFPFLKTKHLVIIGSVVVLVAVILTSIFVIKFVVAKVAIKKPEMAVTKEVPSKVYTVQAYTTSKREDADKVIKVLFSKGFPAAVKEVKSSLGKNLYVIYVGEYVTKTQADEVVQKLRKEKEFKDSIVRVK